MAILKYLPVIAFWAMTAFVMEAGAEVKSYREWKADQVVQAEGKIQTLKSQIITKKTARMAAQGTDPNLTLNKTGLEASALPDKSTEKLEKELKAELYDLELAKDLSVTDYFVGYLTKIQDKKTAFKEVAGKLSPEEVAELMTAYANSVFGAHASDLPVSANNVGKDTTK